MQSLEEKGCLSIGDTNRDGTLYRIRLPLEIPLVSEKKKIEKISKPEDFYTDPEKRLQIFEEDRWTCHYCGEKVSSDNASLDHIIPVCLGGSNERENLKTACLMCNSIKSGKTYEQAAPYLLKSTRERRVKVVDSNL